MKLLVSYTHTPRPQALLKKRKLKKKKKAKRLEWDFMRKSLALYQVKVKAPAKRAGQGLRAGRIKTLHVLVDTLSKYIQSV